MTRADPPPGRREERWPWIPVAFTGVVASGLALFAFSSSPVYGVATVLVLVVAAVAWIRGRTRRRPLAFAAGWLSAPGALILLVLWVSGSFGDAFLTRRFDDVTWRAKRDASFLDRTRTRMVEDLRRSGRLEGRTRLEAIALLGEPSQRSWGTAEDALYWSLGADGALGIDASWLRLRFDASGRVAAHDVVVD